MAGAVSTHVRACWVHFAIDLHPSRSNDAMQGVRDQLQNMLMRYSDELQGVMLAYSKEKLLSLEAMVHPYFPYFHVDVTALVFVFQPIAGVRLRGVVNAVGQDYIGVLVMGIFNAAIGREFIPPHLQSRILERCWVSTADRRQRIRVGDSLSFVVHKVHHESDFFTLAGSLLADAAPAAAAGPAAGGAPVQQAAAAETAAGEAHGQPHKQKKKRPRMSTMYQLPAEDSAAADPARSTPAPASTAPAHHLMPDEQSKMKKKRHSRTDAGPSSAAAVPDTHVHSSKKRKLQGLDAAAPGARQHQSMRQPAAAAASAPPNGLSPAALGAGSQDGDAAVLDAASVAKRLAKQQRKQAAAAAAAAAAGPSAVGGGGGQPSHRKEAKRRHSETFAVSPGANLANGTAEKPKKRKRHKSSAA